MTFPSFHNVKSILQCEPLAAQDSFILIVKTHSPLRANLNIQSLIGFLGAGASKGDGPLHSSSNTTDAADQYSNLFIKYTNVFDTPDMEFIYAWALHANSNYANDGNGNRNYSR